ncbi:MAG: phage tail tape measure protein [Eubacteriales bacterium]|nr:phage tail tape measure protein [Eubacteriales bacterium]
MAERRVSTRFAVEGESQYKAALKNINSELKVLDSELKLANSGLKANGESIDALKAKQQALANVITQLEKKIAASKTQTDIAKQAQQQWAQKSEEARQKLEQLQSTTDDAGKETDEYRQKVAAIQAEINRYEAAEQKAKTAVEAHTTETNNAQAKQNQYQGELNETKEALRGLGSASQEQGVKSEGMFASWAKGALTLTAVIAVLRKLAKGLKACVEASIEYEDAFAGVEKTVDASTAQLRGMSEEIRRLATDIPATADDIASVAEAAGQLGIATEDIMGFTEVMIALGVATNMTADEAATSLARFINITGLSSSQLENLASSIVALGNTTATTEKEIVDMGMSLAAAGKQAGLSDAEIMGIAAALSSVGLEADAGGTAFSRWMKDMQVAVETGSDDLEAFASVAGLSAEDFAASWKSSPVDALNSFFQGLGGGSKSAIVLLEEMGITNVRTSDTAIRLANAGDLLTDCVDRSTSSFSENVALTNEAEKRYDTTKSKVEVMKNAFTELAISIGDKLSPKTNHYIELLTNLALGLAGVEEEVSSVQKALETTETAYRDSTEATLAAADVAGQYIDRLAALEAQTSLTDAEQAEYQQIVALLAGLIPGLNLDIDEQNGLLINGAEALKSQVEQWKQLQIVSSVEQARAGYQQAYTDALVEQGVQQQKAIRAEAEWNASIETSMGLLKDKAELLGVETTGWENLTLRQANARIEQAKSVDLTKEQKAELELLNERIEDSASVSVGLWTEWHDASEAAEELGEGAETAQQSLEDFDASVEAIDGLSGAFGSASESVQAFTADEEGLIAYLGEATVQVQDLIAKYQEMGEAAVAGAEQTAGGLLSVVEVVQVASDDVITALQSQTQFFNEYAENIKAAAEHGLNEGLVAALSNGSMESARILAGLASEGWANVDELNAAFEDTQRGKEALETNVSEANATAEGELQKIVDNVNAMVDEFNQSGEATTAGVETINAYVSGLNSNISGVSSAVDEINKAIGKIVRKVSVKVKVETETGKNGGKATGLSYVPYDEFNINLHKGEMVLTALQAEALRAQQRADNYGTVLDASNTTVQNNQTFGGDTKIEVNVSKLVVREEADVRKIAVELNDLAWREKRKRGQA